jgi:hypothetical protein
LRNFFNQRTTEEGTHKAAPSSAHSTQVSPDRSSTRGRPLWATVIGVSVIVVVLVVLSLMLLGVGRRLPGSPLPSLGSTLPSLATMLVTVVLPILVVTTAAGVLVSRLMPRIPGLRKVMLTVHVTSSVGWFGATAALFALGFTEWISQDGEIVRATIIGMAVTAWFVAVPLSFISLFTGLVSSLGTAWGLLRYDWVLLKLLIAASTAVIWLLYAMELSPIANAVLTWRGSLLVWRNASPMFHALGALLLLGLASVLSLY